MCNPQYARRLRACSGARVLFLVVTGWAVLMPLLAPAPVAADGVHDRRFGIIDAGVAPDLARQSGAGWERIRLFWPSIQPDGPDQWQGAAIPETAIEQALAGGREVIGLLIGIPAWAAADGLPRGLYADWTAPENTWATFVRQATVRYAGKIQHWIIWNEPDVWDQTAGGHTWSGSVDDFAQLQRVAYDTIKAANPAASVHLAGMSYYWDAVFGRELYLRRLLRSLARDPQVNRKHWYFDALTLHVYFRPEEVYNLIRLYRNVLRQFGLIKPIWLVETNAAPSLDPDWLVSTPMFRISLEEQAAFIPQALSLALAAGAERIGVYKLVDVPADRQSNPEPFGLARMDSSPRPAFTAYRVATAVLAGARSAWRARQDRVTEVVVNQGDHTTTVIWSRTPQTQTVSLWAHHSTATVIDLFGQRRLIQAVRGRFTLTVPGAICSNTPCLMGGAPVMLVEGRVPAYPF